MLRFNLKDAMQTYEAKTGIHLTYEELSNLTSISVETLKSIATRPEYNATLKMITEIASALNINPVNYFEWNGTKNEK
ncbi:MAG: hypothetical protein KDD61_16940 [Bdellovibrionales bacterium]|nr:hypothetical protein [Bdellovibrionales bacterium]